VGLGHPRRVRQLKPKAWTENVRPSLSDRNGGCDLIGVPEGRNHYYDIDLEAIAMMEELGEKSEWAHFHWTSGEVLPLYGREAEIAAAMRDLDELTFDQEYNASFINFSGRAYYAFDSRTHCKKLAYNPLARSMCALTSTLSQASQSSARSRLSRASTSARRSCTAMAALCRIPQGALLLDRPLMGTGVIGEVYIPRNSNTPAVCRAC
jgi:hypothetical protein